MKVNKPQWARRVRPRCARAAKKSHFILIHTTRESAIIRTDGDLIKNSSQARETSRTTDRAWGTGEGIGKKGDASSSQSI